MEEKNKQTAVRGGIGFVGLLQLLFIAFKLLQVVDWSWWWVLAPLWIDVCVVMLIVVATMIIQAAIGRTGGK